MADKKWYNNFVSFDSDQSAQSESEPPRTSATVPRAASNIPGTKGAPPAPAKSAARPAAGAAPTAAQRVADIAASLGPPPQFKAPVSNPSSFDEIYAAAEIPAPPQGYTIFKIGEMLQSPHIKDLAAEVKRSSILVALDAAGVKLQAVVEDAVRRDRALDTFESLQMRGIQELEAAKNKENQQIQAELDRVSAEHHKRIAANQEAVAKARDRMAAWQKSKQEEEQRIYDAIAPFVTENPVTTARSPGPPAANASKKQD